MPVAKSAGFTLPVPCNISVGGVIGTTSTVGVLLRCAACAAQRRHAERYHGRAFLAPIVTAEVRTDTVDCTPGATKALTEAAARTTRKARNIIAQELYGLGDLG